MNKPVEHYKEKGFSNEPMINSSPAHTEKCGGQECTAFQMQEDNRPYSTLNKIFPSEPAREKFCWLLKNPQ